MKKWIEADGLGRWNLEIVLVYFDIPLMFVCVDEKKNRYLVLCEDEEKGEYLAVKCSRSMLLDMLNNKISMDQTFKNALNGEFIWISYDFVQKKFEWNYKKKEEIVPEWLPDRGAFFELTSEEIKKYIVTLQLEEDCIIYVELDMRCRMETFSNNEVFNYRDAADGWVRDPQIVMIGSYDDKRREEYAVTV